MQKWLGASLTLVFCVNHLFSLVFAWFSCSFQSWQTGNECINNIQSKGIKSVNHKSRAAKTVGGGEVL